MFNPQMVQLSSTSGQTNAIPFAIPQTGKQQQFPFGMANPMMFLPQQTPPNLVSPAQMPMTMPALSPIPLQPQVSTHSTQSDRGEGESAEGETTNKNLTTSPMFPPQTFQPIPMMANPMMMNFNGQQQVSPNLIPMIQVQTPNGPAFQPVYYVNPDMQTQKSFLTPEQHPVQRSDSAASSLGRSTSFDGSDSGDPHRYQHSNSLIRHHSSTESRDGYSDCSNSRLGSGSEFFEGSFCSDVETDDNSKKEETSSKMFYPPGFGGSSGSFDGMVSSMSSLSTSHSYSRKSSDGKRKKSQGDRSYSKRYYQDGKKRPTSKERQEELFKTELCNYWINGQKCRFGKRCIFAHGQHELRLPKRKIERKRLQPPFRKKVVSTLNKLSNENADSMISTLLCSAVEEIRNDKEKSLIFTKALFNKAVNDTELCECFAETWRKLLNIHPMAQVFANQMQDLLISEYMEPRRKECALNAMAFAAELCAKKTLKSEETAHKILSEMFQDGQASEKNVELWCKLIESLKNTVDTNKYFPQLTAMKTRFNARMRFMIMDLEDLKKRNWVRRRQ